MAPASGWGAPGGGEVVSDPQARIAALEKEVERLGETARSWAHIAADAWASIGAALLHENPREYLVGCIAPAGELPPVGADPDEFYSAHCGDHLGTCSHPDCDRQATISIRGGESEGDWCATHDPMPTGAFPDIFDCRGWAEEYAEAALLRAEDARRRERLRAYKPIEPDPATAGLFTRVVNPQTATGDHA